MLLFRRRSTFISFSLSEISASPPNIDGGIAKETEPKASTGDAAECEVANLYAKSPRELQGAATQGGDNIYAKTPLAITASALEEDHIYGKSPRELPTVLKGGQIYSMSPRELRAEPIGKEENSKSSRSRGEERAAGGEQIHAKS